MMRRRHDQTCDGIAKSINNASSLGWPLLFTMRSRSKSNAKGTNASAKVLWRRRPAGDLLWRGLDAGSVITQTSNSPAAAFCESHRRTNRRRDAGATNARPRNGSHGFHPAESYSFKKCASPFGRQPYSIAGSPGGRCRQEFWRGALAGSSGGRDCRES